MEHLDCVNSAHQQLLISIVSGDPASDLEDFLYEWERLTYQRETSSDYQLQEYCKEPHLFNKQVEDIETTLIPFCRSLLQRFRAIEVPPEQEEEATSQMDGDLLELQRLIVDTSLENLPVDISTSPFCPQAFQRQPQQVQLEILRLLDDHKALIEKGESYGTWRSSKQKKYLDQLAQIEEQWTIAFTRFQLMEPCGLNPEYTTQCQQWLAELGLTEEQYRQLHQENLKKVAIAPVGIAFYTPEPSTFQYYSSSENAFQ